MIVDNLILEKCLGKGSFGEVFFTKVKGDDSKKYATKKLDREQIENTEAIKYLKNEITILHNLQHPNIVKFVDIKKTKKHYYIVMEYCNGGELSKALEEYQEKFGKPFSQEIVQHFMRQIISAFKYIHGLKIIHRDVKLDNVLLNFESEKDKEDLNLMKATAKIIDFGFACQVSKKGLVYSTLGSPINMDPLLLKKLNSKSKKARQLGYDQKADVWSLGTICYEMLIGKSAFDAEDMDELIEKIEDGTYTVPTNLSKEIISFINGMLQYEAVKRLNCEQLSQHPFLTKEVKDFQSIDMKKVSKKVGKSGLKINVKNNKSIWAIFNADDEQKLMNIGCETSLSKDDSNNNPQSKEEDNCGPMLPGSNQGIPGNPIDAEFQKGSISDTTYSFSSGGIFDS
jgi:serine/threonine protein kinase